MPKITIHNMEGKEVGERVLNDEIFAVPVHRSLLHSAIKMYLANQREGNHSTLTRAEVRGGGKKPWRQKGTGRARHGSTRSPQWTHGGVAFGPKPREYRFTMNKKARRLALKSALSDKVARANIIVVDNITLGEYKTKAIAAMLAALKSDKKALIITESPDNKIIKSAANIPGIKTAAADNINVYDIVSAGKLIVSSAAVDKIEEVYA